MTATDPEQRPTARQCLDTFRHNAGTVSRWRMLQPVRDCTLWKLWVTNLWAYKYATIHCLDWARIAVKGLFTRLPDAQARFS